MNFLQKGSTEEMQIVEGESDEESVDFSPINEEVWFSSSNSALEVIPHNDVGMHASINRSKRKSYGSPVGQDISTRHVSGKKIDKKHTQFALSAGMMLGVRECVGGLSSLSENDDYNESSPNEKEFTHVEKIKIPAGAYFISNEMSSLPYRYNFKAYAPTIFSNIRAMAGVDKQRFLHSICGNDAFIEFVSNAKSGQFFFYSHDGRYMIKTQTQEEKNFLWQILPHYYNHLKNNPYSFITQFYGMYRVKIPDLGKSIHFVIMKSVFNTEKEIHKIWDLKGSTLGRRAKRGDSVHKDLDFVEEGRKLRVEVGAKENIMAQLKRDTSFLAKMNIMDYSMLLGVHLCSSAEPESISTERKGESDIIRSNTPARRKIRKIILENGGKEGMLRSFIEGAKYYFGSGLGDDSVISQANSDDDSESGTEKDAEPQSRATEIDSEIYIDHSNLSQYSTRDDLGIKSGFGEAAELYFAGIIDILQLYNTRKWGETIMRKAVGNSEMEISCVDPDSYADRFVNFMDSIIE